MSGDPKLAGVTERIAATVERAMDRSAEYPNLKPTPVANEAASRIVEQEIRPLVEALRGTLTLEGHYGECFRGKRGYPIGEECSFVCRSVVAVLARLEEP